MISTKSLENLIPGFLMESDLFHLVILSVEAKVLKHNRCFAELNPKVTGTDFCDFLTTASTADFIYSLELVLNAPKLTQHLMLNHPASDGEKQARVWWGFSVVTDPEMDLSGVIGFGVELQHLEQKLPWTNLINVLGFGEIILDRKFKVTAIPEGYQLCLVPRKTPAQVQESRALIPENVFSALPGAVFVLDKAGKLCQQNEAAKTMGRIWKGRAYSEGFSLTFPTQPNRFSKLLRAIEDAKKGFGSDLELKLLKPSRVFEFWSASVRPLPEGAGSSSGILIQVFDVSEVKSQVFKINRENERLRDLALSPSHILRGPLSSIIGLLDLIDAKQLDEENQNLFGYLKPLTKELDRTIRQHAKKMSTFE